MSALQPQMEGVLRYLIDTDAQTIRCLNQDQPDCELGLYSLDGFRLLSGLWLKQEWTLQHWQSFTWLGLPIWQLPEDLLRIQEVIVRLKPDVIVETGLQRGGSAVFFASLCRLLGTGRVISVELAIDNAVRAAVESSPVANLITLIEGDSADPAVVARVKAEVASGERALVFLDSDHAKAHVLAELEAYAGLVGPGSYLVATDGIMRDLAETPRGRAHWVRDNPAAAAQAFAAAHPEFVLERPQALYRNDRVINELTYWPDAWLRRRLPT